MWSVLLTAAPQSVAGGRRAAAGGSEAAARTAGTKTVYPAGVHEKPHQVHTWRQKKRTFGCWLLANTKSYRGVGGNGVQSEEVSDVHFPEYVVQFGRLIVQETQRRNCGRNSNTHSLSHPAYTVSLLEKAARVPLIITNILTIHWKAMKRNHTCSKKICKSVNFLHINIS